VLSTYSAFQLAATNFWTVWGVSVTGFAGFTVEDYEAISYEVLGDYIMLNYKC